MNGWVWLTILGVLWLIVYSVDCWLHPFTYCRKCKGDGKFNSWLSRKRWRRCRRCGGTGQRVHPMRRILNALGRNLK